MPVDFANCCSALLGASPNTAPINPPSTVDLCDDSDSSSCESKCDVPIPDEVLLSILLQLPMAELFRSARVTRRWLRLVQSSPVQSKYSALDHRCARHARGKAAPIAFSRDGAAVSEWCDQGIVSNLVLSADGRYLFTGCYDGLVRAWSIVDLNCDLGGQCGRDTPYTDDAYLIAPAPNGRVFSVGLAYRGNKTVSVVNAWHSAGTGSVWDADISFDAGQLSGPSDQLLVSPDGQHLFTRDRTAVLMWDTSDQTLKKARVTQGVDVIKDMAVSPDGTTLYLITQGRQGEPSSRIRAWSVGSDAEDLQLEADDRTAAPSDDGFSDEEHLYEVPVTVEDRLYGVPASLVDSGASGTGLAKEEALCFSTAGTSIYGSNGSTTVPTPTIAAVPLPTVPTASGAPIANADGSWTPTNLVVASTGQLFMAGPSKTEIFVKATFTLSIWSPGEPTPDGQGVGPPTHLRTVKIPAHAKGCCRPKAVPGPCSLAVSPDGHRVFLWATEPARSDKGEPSCIQILTDDGDLLHTIDTTGKPVAHLVVGADAHFFTSSTDSILKW